MSRLAEPLARAIGNRPMAQALAKQGIETVGDLLRHYPSRYQRWGELTPLRELPVGQDATVLVEVRSAVTRPMRQRRGDLLSVVASDGVDELSMTFFNAGKLRHVITPGLRALFSGTVERYKGTPQLTHPKMEVLRSGDDAADAIARIEGPVAVYPSVRGVDSEKLRRSIGVLLDVLDDVPDPVPAQVRARHGLVGLRQALLAIHRPADEDEAREARRRLRFEEAFVLQAALARRRWAEGALPAMPRHATPGGLLERFDARLPFALTQGQRDVGEELARDLAAVHPMHRLLQGEVGSGKTVVALRAMLTVVDAGGQAALLAPTEVLAAQHHRSITAMLGDLAEGGLLGGDEQGTRVVLLTGSMPAGARRSALLDAAVGDAGIVVGTHALLAESVEFFDLGLVVVDEQHRFGVEQRDALRSKGRTTPHLLVMTATPIPRTVAMTVFGDLEVSTLAELPAGRPTISTHVVPLAEHPAWLERTWQRVREEVDAGHRVYVVCPRIGEGAGVEELPEPPVDQPAGDGDGEDGSPKRPPLAVLDLLPRLREHPALAGLRIEPLHGRLPADERDAAMRAFAAGAVDVLVATTVIEVGVDVPAASTMVVLDAERFGVSQLHQLRGRVGRGTAPGLCLLVTEAVAGTPSRGRLDAVARTLDGFELAQVDLAARREGDVLSARQSGRTSLKLLRVLQHEKVIETARHEASAVVAADPDLVANPALAEAIRLVLDPDQEAYLDRG